MEAARLPGPATSLPPHRLIPLLRQAPIDEIDIALSWVGAPEYAAQQAERRSAGRSDKRPGSRRAGDGPTDRATRSTDPRAGSRAAGYLSGLAFTLLRARGFRHLAAFRNIVFRRLLSHGLQMSVRIEDRLRPRAS